MIVAERRTVVNELKYLFWPPYRRRVDDETRRNLERLMADPSLPCMVGGYIIHDGYGNRA